MTEEEKKKGLARLNPADTYREAFAQAVTPSNEIDYTQSNADRIIKDYQESELAGVVNSIKPEEGKTPVTHDDVPIIDTTVEYEPPTEEMKKFEEEKTQAQWEKDYFDSIWSKEDEEAAEKKKKAAQWITAAQMLGDSLSALGNSYFVAKGANNMGASQGASKAAEATSKLYQDIREAREKAAKAKMDATLRKYQMELQRKKDEQAQENWQKTFDANEAYRAQQQRNFETTEARLAEQARLNAENEKIRIDIAKQNASIQLKNTLDKNKPYPMAVNGEIYEIPIKKVNEQIIGSIFAKLPEEVRMSAGSPRYGKDAMNNSVIVGYNNPSLTDMLAAIGTYGNEETAKEIMKLAGVKVEEITNDEFGTGGGRGASAAPNNVQTGKEVTTPTTKKKVW